MRISLSLLCSLMYVMCSLPICLSQAHGQTLLEKVLSKKEGIRLSILRGPSNSAVTILLSLPKKKTVSPELFTIADPTRLVIDIPHLPLTIAKNFEVPAHPLIRAVRIGSHPDKVRLVVDMTTAPSNLSYQLHPRDDGFTIDVSFSSLGGPQSETPMPSPTITVQPESTAPPATLSPQTPDASQSSPASSHPPSIVDAVATPTDIPVTVSPTDIPELMVTVGSATPLPETPTSENLQGQALHSISFDYFEAARTPVVRFSFSERPQYKLTKMSETAFKLTIPKVGLITKQLRLPQFPPQDFIGFTLIHATPRESRLEIIIGVDRGVKINAITKEKDILVRAAAP